MSSVSLYMFAGDFTDVLRRYHAGLEQSYQTHNEVARLLLDLTGAGVSVTVYSLVTPEVRDERPMEGLRVVSLGAPTYESGGRLRAAVQADTSAKAVVHFPNEELLAAVMASPARAISILANSYNGRGVRAALERRRIAKVMNSERFEWVSNHCVPATEHLASMGVQRSKLVPWDVPHPRHPVDVSPKQLPTSRPLTVMFVGSIVESKGVGDLIRAAALLRSRGTELRVRLAGNGEIAAMTELAQEQGVADLVEFLGIIGNETVADHMRAADVVAVPSRREYTEGFPLTMFEAIASRTPIVCTDHPMFRQHMIDGRSAVVFPSGDVGAFATGLQRLIGSAALYEQLSVNAIDTWETLRGPADWRTFLRSWITDQDNAWIAGHTLSTLRP